MTRKLVSKKDLKIVYGVPYCFAHIARLEKEEREPAAVYGGPPIDHRTPAPVYGAPDTGYYSGYGGANDEYYRSSFPGRGEDERSQR